MSELPFWAASSPSFCFVFVNSTIMVKVIHWRNMYGQPNTCLLMTDSAGTRVDRHMRTRDGSSENSSGCGQDQICETQIKIGRNFNCWYLTRKQLFLFQFHNQLYNYFII